MTTITKREWIDNIGLYEFDKGYQGVISVVAEEHNILSPERVSVKLIIPLHLLKTKYSTNCYNVTDTNPVKTQEEGKERGEKRLLRLIYEFEAEQLEI